MQACLCTILAAATAIAPAPTDPAAVFRQLESRMQEHVEQRRYETLAHEAEAAYTRRDLTPEQRRAMAFFAVHGLHGMWEVGRRAAGLCQARDLLRRVERELGFANDRTIADRLRRETETALQETGLRNPCAPARATPAQRAPLAAAPQPDAQAPTPVVPAPPPAVPQDMVPEPDAPPLLASQVGRQPPVAEGAAPLDSAPAIPAPNRRRREPLPPSHIAGATLLFAAGTAGWVGVGVLLREATKVDDAVASIKLNMEAEGRTKATPTEVMQFNRYIDQHERLTAGAAAIGSLAGLATLGGVLLVAIRPRSSSRMAARPWGTPWSAGVSLAGSF